MQAMDMGTGMSLRPSAFIAWLALTGASVSAEVTIVPRLSLSETLTDNVRLNDQNQKSELVTQLSPGLRVDIKGARLKTFFDYALTHVSYARGTASGRTQNALNTFGTLEAIDNWAYVDFSGSIAQQAVSAFQVQPIDNTSISANRSEVSTYRVSPYLRGRVGNSANYEARYTQSQTSGNSALSSDVTSSDGSIKLTGGSAFRRLGWSAEASRKNIDYSTGRTTEADRFNLGLTYAITPQVNAVVNGGHEANNYTTLDKQGYAVHGFGFNWTPSERTKLSASRNQRSFGQAHSVSFEHRTARTAWKFSDSRDVSVTPSQTGLLLNTETIVPSVISSFLTSAVSLQRRQDLSFSLFGVRDTITFSATRSESTRLDTLSVGQDDLNTSAVVNQRGFSASYAHRLTPDYSLGVVLSQQDTSGVLSNQDNTLRALNVNVSGKVGHRTSATVSARRVVSSGSLVPYTENAVTGNLNVQF